MRVVHLDTGREWRGGQVQLALLARHLAGRVEQRVLCPKGSPLWAALSTSGIEVAPLDPWRLRAASGGADLVAAHTSRAHTWALLGATAPVIVHRRVDFAPRMRRKYRAVHGFVAVSHAVARVLGAAGVEPGRIRVVHDGVDVARWTAPPGPGPAIPRPWVVACGALVAHKGHAVLLDAVARIPGLTAVLLGEGPLGPALAAQARALGIEDRVRWAGAVADPLPWLAAADVFVHPSLEEGLGQVVIEALLAGAAVVASAAGGIPEVVGERGRLVPPADVRALADALCAVLADPAPWRMRAREGRDALAGSFGSGATADGTLRAWQSLLATPPRRSSGWLHSRS